MTPDAHTAPRLLLLGDARQVHLLRWARYFARDGWEVATVSLEPGQGYPGHFEHIQVSTLLPDAIRYPAAVGRVRDIAAGFRPHVVNAHFVPNYGTIATRLGHHPWVLSTWGSDVMTDPDKSVFHRWRTRRALRSADWVTSDAAVMTEKIAGFGVAPDRILTFPYGVDTRLFCAPQAAPPDGPAIISIRKFEAVYSVATLVDAFSGVLDTLPGARLTLAGDGSLRGELTQRANDSAGADRIEMPGAFDHEEVPSLLARHHIYVSTATSDTTSVSLLEAMACGLFPVVTDIPANREWVEDGRGGLLFPPGDTAALRQALIRAWAESGQRQEARERNFEVIRSRALWEDTMEGPRRLMRKLAGAMEPHDPGAVQQP
jgi:glycosyltransferase involved in cell wall biosynthesis